MKKRQANFELLRVVAMAMIVAMHFMNRGNILKPLTGNITVVNCVAWGLEAFCIVAANCYVLIAGYFLVDAEWKLKKVWSLVLQVLFYSLMVPAVCMIFQIGTVREWTIYEWITAVLPLQMDHYWFATAYLLMFSLSPVLAAGVKQLTEKQHRMVISVLLIYFCVFKTVIPLRLANDKFGYDFPWFICLFLIAAYIRLYFVKGHGIQILKRECFKTRKSCIWIYVFISLLILIVNVILALINSSISIFDHYMNMMISYNHILVLLSSVALFMSFLMWDMKENKIGSFILKIAPYMFGVYLLHENVAIRTIWVKCFFVDKFQNSLLFIPLMFIAIVVVMSVGTVVDFLRKKLFSLILK